MLFKTVQLLDAGSGLSSTRLGIRHDEQNYGAFLNYDTASQGRGVLALRIIQVWVIDNCNLEFVCFLVLVIWDLKAIIPGMEGLNTESSFEEYL